jgi:2-dehydropantoate 2-reductase
MDGLCIVGTPGSLGLSLSFADLAAMPENVQVRDVSALVPGRAGSGVRLAALLERARATARARYVNIASGDPAFAVSLPLSEAAGAVVVYSLDGAELPEGKGGPFRLLVPGHRDECVHVKQVARIELSDRPGRDTRPIDDAEHERLHRKKKGT